jgi:hypothetical protein
MKETLGKDRIQRNTKYKEYDYNTNDQNKQESWTRKEGREDKEEPEKRTGDKEMYYCHPAI